LGVLQSEGIVLAQAFQGLHSPSECVGGVLTVMLRAEVKLHWVGFAWFSDGPDPSAAHVLNPAFLPALLTHFEETAAVDPEVAGRSSPLDFNSPLLTYLLICERSFRSSQPACVRVIQIVAESASSGASSARMAWRAIVC
jgi:hypothetical protein